MLFTLRHFVKNLSFHTRFLGYASLALILIIFDQHFYFVQSAKRYLDEGVYGIQWMLYQPIHWIGETVALLQSQSRLYQSNHQLRDEVLQLKTTINQLKIAKSELLTLKKLLALQQPITNQGCVGRLYGWRDPFIYQLVLDKGTDFHLQNGQPVVDERGLLGQISRVGVHMSVITLIVHSGQMIPVMVERTGERTMIYGQDGGLSLPYWSLSSDIQANDRLVTSGIDGVYPAGLPVARVNHVTKKLGSHFAHLDITPLAGMLHARYALVLSSYHNPIFLPQPLSRSTLNRLQP